MLYILYVVKRGVERFDHDTYRLTINLFLISKYFSLAFLVFGLSLQPLVYSAKRISFLTGTAPLVVFHGVASSLCLSSHLFCISFQIFGGITCLLMTRSHSLVVLGLYHFHSFVVCWVMSGAINTHDQSAILLLEGNIQLNNFSEGIFCMKIL